MTVFGQIVLGIVLGYILFSITESVVHRYILHAQGRRRKSWRKLGRLGVYINNSWYSHHVVHHNKTFTTNYVTMFDSKQQERELSDFLTKNGKEQIVLNSYGLRVGGFYERLQYLYPHLLWFFVICYLGGVWLTLGALVPLFLYIWVAEYVHPYIHLPYYKAIDAAPSFMRLVIKTRYFKYLARYHFLHHKYISCNFNLMLGGDWFWGCHRSPNKKDLAEMIDLGLYVDDRYHKYNETHI